MIELFVLGTPAPKGSARAFAVKGRAVLAPGGSAVNRAALKSWDVNVREKAREVVGQVEAPPYVDRPIAVRITFNLARPAGHYGKKGLKPSAPFRPKTKPDLDKLVRATLDSLTGIVFDDDSRIAVLAVEKQYAIPGNEGAYITIEGCAA